jgi:hypothetical protein
MGSSRRVGSWRSLLLRWTSELRWSLGTARRTWPTYACRVRYTEGDSSPLAVAREAGDKWVAADLEGFLSLWDPTGVWTNAGNSQISGTRRGHDEIAKVAQIVFSGGTFKARPIELAARVRTQCSVTSTARPSGPGPRSTRTGYSVSWFATARSSRFTTSSPIRTRPTRSRTRTRSIAVGHVGDPPLLIDNIYWK